MSIYANITNRKPIDSGIYEGIYGQDTADPLVFHALTHAGASGGTDAAGNTLLPYEGTDTLVATVAGLTEARTSTNYAPDHEGVWRSWGSGEAVREGWRVVTNICTETDDLTGSTWAVKTLSIATGQTDPEGGSTAFRLTATADNQYYQQSFSTGGGNALTAGTSVRFSAWVKRVTGTGAVSLHTGNGTAPENVTSAVTTSWKRISASVVTAGGSSDRIGFRLDTDGDAIDVWHPQFEIVDGQANQNPSEYVENTGGVNTTAKKYFASTNPWEVTSNVATPTATVTELTDIWTKGEPAHTNSQIYSNDLTNAEWTASNVTVAKDAVGLTGAANSACTLTATAGNGTVIANAITAASATHVTRWFIKRKTGTGTVELTLDNGSTWNDITAALDAASGWYYEPTEQAALTNPQIGIRIVTSGDAVEVGNAECHLATTIAALRGSSPIFTSGSAASTVASAMSFSDANHSDDQGLWFCEFMSRNIADYNFVLGVGLGRFLYKNNAGTTIIAYDGTNLSSSGALSTDAASKISVAYGSGQMNVVADGVQDPTPASYDGEFNNSLSKIAVCGGNAFSSPVTTMLIRDIRRYNLPYASAVTKAEEVTA